jgi:hypothetical protein
MAGNRAPPLLLPSPQQKKKKKKKTKTKTILPVPLLFTRERVGFSKAPLPAIYFLQHVPEEGCHQAPLRTARGNVAGSALNKDLEFSSTASGFASLLFYLQGYAAHEAGYKAHDGPTLRVLPCVSCLASPSVA